MWLERRVLDASPCEIRNLVCARPGLPADFRVQDVTMIRSIYNRSMDNLLNSLAPDSHAIRHRTRATCCSNDSAEDADGRNGGLQTSLDRVRVC